MALPRVLFSSSSSDFSARQFVKNILEVSELPQPTIVTDGIESFEWSFETKYYTVTVELCTTENRTIGDEEFAQSVQAFIHFFDTNVPSSFELSKAWLPYLQHIEPDIKMLVCHTSLHSDAVSRKTVLEWCIQNMFELVELSPEQDSGDEDDDFPESTGMTRIVQALHAHTWPNLDMKSSPIIQSSYLRHMMKEQHLLSKDKSAQNSTHEPYTSHGTDTHNPSHEAHTQDPSHEAHTENPSQLSCEPEPPTDIPNLGQTFENSINVSVAMRPDIATSVCGAGTTENSINATSVCSAGDTENSNKATSVCAGTTENFINATSVCAGTTENSATSVCSAGDTENSNTATSASASEPDLEDLLQLNSINWRTLLANESQLNDESQMTSSTNDVDEFEKLFMKLKVMKDQAENMASEERKKFAEKVAISFWKAIGGDEEEIDGLDEDSD